MTTKTITEAQLRGVLIGKQFMRGATANAAAIFAALPDSSFRDAEVQRFLNIPPHMRADTGLDVERLARAAATALDRWFGPPADGMSAATRRAIVDEMVAVYARLTEPLA